MNKICTLFLMLGIATFAQAKDKTIMSISSNSWRDGELIADMYVFNGFGCSGQNLSPHIAWKNLPDNTKSVAVLVYDPDAPTGSGWWHWIVYNIPNKVSSLSKGEGKLGAAILSNGASQNNNDFGSVGYGGPCPPQADKPHRYILTVHALDVEKIELPANASGAMAGFNINAHTIEKKSITGLYSRDRVSAK